MDDSSIEDPITIKQKFGHISNEESLKIANAIDDDLLLFFIKEVVQESDLNVIPIERKGLNLFHPYLNNIEGLRNVISIKPLSYYQGPKSLRYKYFAVFNLDKSNILLTDAIATGSEIRKILRWSPFKLKSFGGFKKVCGYLALKSALDELEREFPQISFKFLKIVGSIEEYYEEHSKIIYVYQKRMEPIDEEHPFIVIEIVPEIGIGEIKTRITKIINEQYGNDFEVRDNDNGIASKHIFTIYFNNPLEILKDVLKIRLQDGDDIEKLAIRLKFSSQDSKLRIMALSMPHLNSETKMQHVKRIVSSSCNRKVPNRRCNENILLKILSGHNRCLLCAECIDVNVSVLLLKAVYSSISKSGLMKVS
jgi:hypothetical protein